MIDLRAARKDPESFRTALARKGAAEVFDDLLEADRAVREVQPRVEELRAARKVKGKPTPEQLEELERVKTELQSLEQQLTAAEGRRKELLDRVPNPPDEATPDGETEDDAVEIRRWGDPPSFDFPVKDHLELAGRGIDLERGAKVSGSRFAFRSGDVARLELALYRFALDRLTSRGFTPVLPPVLVREEAMYGTGFFPTDEVNIYAVERDELFLVGTSEVPLAAMHGAEILDADELPLRYAGYSTCFRREAGAAGKDTRGMFRVHQFDKVEMFVFTRPEWSREEHDRLLDIEEELVQELELPYRVVNVAAGDLGASATKKYDIEAWFPTQERYREITSTSNTTDYQARRLEIRHRRNDKQLEPVHTLNGTAVTARAMLAIMENFQDEDGSIAVPEPLVEFGASPKLGAERAPA
jgi:seryl-tRNA synthetase